MDTTKPATWEIGTATSEGWLVQFGPYATWEEANLARTRHYLRTGDRVSPLEIRERVQ